MSGKFKFQVQDSDLEYLLWRFALSEKKLTLVSEQLTRFLTSLCCKLGLDNLNNFCFSFIGLLWQNSARHVREWVDTIVWKMWHHLGPPAHDGPHDRPQPRLRICHLYYPRCCSRGCAPGRKTIFLQSKWLNRMNFFLHLKSTNIWSSTICLFHLITNWLFKDQRY